MFSTQAVVSIGRLPTPLFKTRLRFEGNFAFSLFFYTPSISRLFSGQSTVYWRLLKMNLKIKNSCYCWCPYISVCSIYVYPYAVCSLHTSKSWKKEHSRLLVYTLRSAGNHFLLKYRSRVFSSVIYWITSHFKLACQRDCSATEKNSSDEMCK